VEAAPSGLVTRCFAPERLPLVGTVAVLLLLFVGGGLRYEGFASMAVVASLLADNAFIGIAAVGATLVILSGGIDLSVGAVVAFTGILVARLLHEGVDPAVAIAVALSCGTLLGMLQGWLIQCFALPPFLVTLAGMFLMRGLGFMVHPHSIAITHSFYAETLANVPGLPLGGGAVLPGTGLLLLAAVATGWAALRYTEFGRSVYALGSNETSAELMGVPVGATKILIYTAAGALSAAAGVMATIYMQSGNPASFVGLELDVIAAVVIGGTLLTGGAGSMLGTFAGVMILGLVQTLVTFQGTLNSWWTRIVIGLLLLAFIALQRAVSASAQGREQ
jgi:galactofuranose transport system permease protein